MHTVIYGHSVATVTYRHTVDAVTHRYTVATVTWAHCRYRNIQAHHTHSMSHRRKLGKAFYSAFIHFT